MLQRVPPLPEPLEGDAEVGVRARDAPRVAPRDLERESPPLDRDRTAPVRAPERQPARGVERAGRPGEPAEPLGEIGRGLVRRLALLEPLRGAQEGAAGQVQPHGDDVLGCRGRRVENGERRRGVPCFPRCRERLARLGIGPPVALQRHVGREVLDVLARRRPCERRRRVVLGAHAQLVGDEPRIEVRPLRELRQTRPVPGLVRRESPVRRLLRRHALGSSEARQENENGERTHHDRVAHSPRRETMRVRSPQDG